MLRSMLAAAGYNPFDGTSPTFGPFAQVLGPKLTLFLGIVWAASFVYAGYHFVLGLARMSNASRRDVPDVALAARREIGYSAGSAVVLVLVPVIWAVLVS